MGCSDCSQKIKLFTRRVGQPKPLIAEKKRCFCYLGDLLNTGYICGERIMLTLDFDECKYNDPRIGEDIDFTCPQYLFDIGMFFVNTDAFPGTIAWIVPGCLPGVVIHQSDAVYWGLYFQSTDDPNIYPYTLSCLPQFGVYDDCGKCECCCGCC